MFHYIFLSYYSNIFFPSKLISFCSSLQVIDKSFGFDTSVEEAQRAINAAHVEATSIENGIGLVKLMGRNSGKHFLWWASKLGYSLSYVVMKMDNL